MNENLSLEELRDFLNEKVEKYNCPKFVPSNHALEGGGSCGG